MEISELQALKESLREEWKELWMTRFDDEVKAEGIAIKSFNRLFVDKGEVIIATRDYKPLSFRQILQAYMPNYIVERVDPNPSRGGWGKFIREHIANRRARKVKGSPRPIHKVDERIRNHKTHEAPRFKKARFKRLKKVGKKRWKPCPV